MLRCLLTRLTVVSLTFVSLLPMISCTRIYPVRTLPAWVQDVYVPMIENKSLEPGLEEIATRKTQEEFLADGRLTIAPKNQADVSIVATIMDYNIRIEDTSNDDIPEQLSIIMLTRLMLYDPYHEDAPMADLGTIETIYTYYSDYRSIGYVPEPDAKEEAMLTLARQIVNQTITGFPTHLRDLPGGTELPNVIQPDATARRNLLRNRTEILD